jgi:hypothetical protein
VLAVPVLANQFADVRAAGAVSPVLHLPVDEGLERCGE